MRSLPAFNGTHIHWGVEIGDGIDGSGDWGLYSLSVRITAIIPNKLNGLGCRLRSLRLGGTIGC